MHRIENSTNEHTYPAARCNTIWQGCEKDEAAKRQRCKNKKCDLLQCLTKALPNLALPNLLTTSTSLKLSKLQNGPRQFPPHQAIHRSSEIGGLTQEVVRRRLQRGAKSVPGSGL